MHDLDSARRCVLLVALYNGTDKLSSSASASAAALKENLVGQAVVPLAKACDVAFYNHHLQQQGQKGQQDAVIMQHRFSVTMFRSGGKAGTLNGSLQIVLV